MISNKLFQYICTLDQQACKQLANTLNSKLDDVLLTGFPLSDSSANGYSKAIHLIRKLLLCDIDSREGILNEINELDLSYYQYNSCKSCFNDGFMRAVNQLGIEIENYNKSMLS